MDVALLVLFAPEGLFFVGLKKHERMKSILIVDDNPNVRSMLQAHLAKRYTADSAEDACAALEMVAKKNYDMIISDIEMGGMSGLDLLPKVIALQPQCAPMLITGYDIDRYIPLAVRNQIGSIMPKSVPFDFFMLDVMVDGLLWGNIFGLKRYLRVGGEVFERLCVKGSSDARSVRDWIVSRFTSRFGDAGDMNLLLDEAITNAVYHAPRNVDGSEKYVEYADVSLLPHEYVFVEYGVDSEKYAISVTDNQGTLNGSVVLDRLSRQVSGVGLRDEGGRGFHIGRIFSDAMVVNIKRLACTEVILMNYFSPQRKASRPLYINEVL